MPKTPARDDYFAQSFRFTPEQAATIKDEAKRLGSTTAFVRTMFGLPGIQVEVLEADMKSLKIPTQPEASFQVAKTSNSAGPIDLDPIKCPKPYMTKRRGGTSSANRRSRRRAYARGSASPSP